MINTTHLTGCFRTGGSLFILFHQLTMRLLLLLLLIVNNPAWGRFVTADTTAHKRKLPEGFVIATYGSELWIVGHNIRNTVSTHTYPGRVLSLGAGLRSRAKAGKIWGYGLTVDFLHYTLDATITQKELVPAGYSYLRFRPDVLLRLPTHGKINYYLAGSLGLLMGMQDNVNGYVQPGLRLGAGYKALELSLAYESSRKSNAPATIIQSDSWREQMFSLNALIFPARIKGWKKVLNFFSSDR